MDEELKKYLDGMEKRILEAVRGMQAELIASIESGSSGQSIRLQKLEERQATFEYVDRKRHCP